MSPYPTHDEDSLLQLALSINPTKIDPFDAQQDDEHVLNDNIVNGCATGPSDRNPNVFSQKVPPNATDLQSVDALIVSEMTKLSVDDREKVYMDIHGVSSDHVTETPELIHINLLELQNEIELLPDKQAYNLAEKMDSDYVHDRDFRLAFLRCEKFDCPKAALRIVRHFQMKLDLFGMERLVMDITQDDLDADDMDILYSGTGRFLKTRDRGGRIINLIVTVPKVFKTDAWLRKGFYNIMLAFLRDEDAQRQGAVNIVFDSETSKAIREGDPELLWKLPKLNEGSPMRITAIHWCWSHEIWKERQGLMKTAFSTPLKVRIRVHHGTVQDCLKALRGHGIDPSSIPINDKCEITDMVEERRRLEEQRRYERLSFPLRNTVYVPFCQDVLLGKGTPFQNHPGNKMLRQLVSDHIKHYDKAQRREKGDIVSGIMDAIRQSGGLFLKQDGNAWSRVNDEVARLKVTAAFRTFRHSLKQSRDSL